MVLPSGPLRRLFGNCFWFLALRFTKNCSGFTTNPAQWVIHLPFIVCLTTLIIQWPKVSAFGPLALFLYIALISETRVHSVSEQKPVRLSIVVRDLGYRSTRRDDVIGSLLERGFMRN